MDTIKLRFISNKSFMSLVVRVFTRSKFSHVDYIFNDGRAYSSLPKDGVGFNEDINDYIEEYTLEVPSKKAVEDFLLLQQGKPYDWRAIISMPFCRCWEEDDKWFCSELICAAIKAGGVELYNESLDRITPRDLAIHPALKKINN